MTKRRRCHSLRVDRIGLAEGAVGASMGGHQLGRHANRALTASDQVALQAAGDVAAVLDGEHSFLVEPSRPGHELLVAARACTDRAFASNLAGRSVDRDGGMGLLVRVDPHYDHSWSPFGREHRTMGPPADTPQWGGCTLL
jgi:hypothetical protein